MININIPIFKYQTKFQKDEKPHLVGSPLIESDNDTSDTECYTNFFTELDENNRLLVHSEIFVPAYLVHNNDTQKGTFYKFENETVYLLFDVDEIFAEHHAELTQVHISRCAFLIGHHTSQIGSNYSYPFGGFSKLLLHFESLHKSCV